MIERRWVFGGVRHVLPWLLWAGCHTAHDVDAISPGLRDDDASVDEGASGTSGRGAQGGRSGSGAAGREGTAGGIATAGSSGGGAGSGAGTGGRGGGGRGGGGNLPCSPCSNAMGSMGMMLSACCTADNQCGVDIGPVLGGGSQCVRQNAPGNESEDCPSYTFQENFELTSCCGGDGFCGVFIRQTAPLGCVDPELLGDLVSEDQGGGGRNMGGGRFGGQNMGGGDRERCND